MWRLFAKGQFRNLPDLILVDLKADGLDAPYRTLLVFVEVVATARALTLADGPHYYELLLMLTSTMVV